MIGLPAVRSYYLYTKDTDMRKSFNGLGGLVINEMKMNLTGGIGFLFINKRRNMVKILVWDRTGFVIYCKKLVRGTFEIPEKIEGEKKLSLPLSTLIMMLEGVSLKSIKMRKRYSLPEVRNRA